MIDDLYAGSIESNDVFYVRHDDVGWVRVVRTENGAVFFVKGQCGIPFVEMQFPENTFRSGAMKGTPENLMVLRLRGDHAPTVEQLFLEGQKVICNCGRKMTTYAEFLEHQNSAKGYYENQLRPRA